MSASLGKLHGWRHPAILAVAGFSYLAGYAQFAATSALPDVAAFFGEPVADPTNVAEQLGLSGATFGIAYALIRLASLGALPLAALADRAGRKVVVVACAALGLALTAVASVAPAFWVFALLLAFGRPLLSTMNAVAGVVAAEETTSRDRAYAIALVTAGYGVGAGTPVLLRAVAGDALGFRGVFGLAVVGLVLLPLLGRLLEEPSRFEVVRRERHRAQGATRVLRSTQGDLRARIVRVGLLTASVSFLTGPVNTYLFIFGEGILGVSPVVSFAAVASAGPVGLVGLLAGRACADRVGRIPTAAATYVFIAMAGMLTYSGTTAALLGGYLTTILFGSAHAPAFGAIATENFPTRIRATVAGGLTACGVVGAVAGLAFFGVLIDVLGSFGAAAVAVGVPVLAAGVLFRGLPETRGQELEESGGQ